MTKAKKKIKTKTKEKPLDVVKISNDFRDRYDELSFKEHKTFYQNIIKHYPDQNRVDLHHVNAFIRRIMATQAKQLNVLELGGFKGKLAKHFIECFKPESLVNYVNYDIIKYDSTHLMRSGKKNYVFHEAEDFLWEVEDWKLTGYRKPNVFIASHILEHLSTGDLNKLLDRLISEKSIQWIYFEAPLVHLGQDWTNYPGFHVLKTGWDHILERLRNDFSIIWRSKYSFTLKRRKVTNTQRVKRDEKISSNLVDPRGKIAVQMIIGKDSEAELERCLDSAFDVFDYGYLSVTIVDPNKWNTTKIREILDDYGAIISEYHSDPEWPHPWLDHFSKARNVSLANVPDDASFVFVMDSDYIIHNGYELRDQILNVKIRPAMMELWEFDFESDSYIANVRVWSNKMAKWVGRVHNNFQIIDKNIKDDKYPIVRLKGLHFTHDYNRAPRVERTLSMLRKAQEEEPNNLRYVYYLCREVSKIENWGETIAWGLLRLDKKDRSSEHFDTLCLLSAAYFQLKQFQKAYDYAMQALACNPEYPNPYCYVGIILARLEKFELAIEWFRMAMSLPASSAGWAEHVKFRTTVPSGMIQECYVGMKLRDEKIAEKQAMEAKEAKK